MTGAADRGGEAVNLGLDLDGVLDEATPFFSLLTSVWPGKVVVISYRADYDKARADLNRLGIHFDHLVLVDSFDAKADVIAEQSIQVYIDDQAEMIKNIPEHVHVMLFRNGGNFEFEDRLWLFSEQTARLI